MSSARIPNAATIMPDPNRLHIVIDPWLNKTSVMRTRTIVRRFPTDVRTGPHTPRRIWRPFQILDREPCQHNY